MIIRQYHRTPDLKITTIFLDNMATDTVSQLCLRLIPGVLIMQMFWPIKASVNAILDVGYT